MIAAAHRHLDGRDYRLVDPDYKSGKETNCSIATWQICEDYFGLELTAEAKALLADKGYDPSLGARPLRRAIQRCVEIVQGAQAAPAIRWSRS